MAEVAAQQAAFAFEQARIAARRTTLGAEAFPATAIPRGDATVGLALSGGGIRSATFALGLLRALSDAGLIRYVDYLSTVSGGGYTGAFLCSHYVPAVWRGDVDEAPDDAPVFQADDPFVAPGGSAAFEHLRQSGRHLLPGGTGDAIRLAAMMTRNWLAVQLVIGLTLLAIYLAFKPFQAWLLLEPQLMLEARYIAPYLPPWLWPSQWLHGYPVSHWFVGSPLWLFAGLGVVVQSGLFWAYFLTRGNPHMARSRVAHALGPSLLLALPLLGLGVVMAGASWPPGGQSTEARAVGAAVALFATVAVIAYVAAELRDWFTTRDQLHARQQRLRNEHAPPRTSTRSDEPRVQEDRVRLLLTNWNGLCLRITLAIAAFALLDSVAQTIYLRWDELASLLAVGGGAAIAIPLLRQALLKLPGLGSRGGGAFAQVARRFGRLLALAAGVVLAAVIGTVWAVLAHFIAWRGAPIGSLEDWHRIAWGPPALGALSRLDWLALTAVAFAAIALVIGVCFAFLNLSSFAHFYADRLRRAYLGASNADRRADGTAVNADHVNDDVPLARYYADGVLAPLHLINVTINDTASRASNTVHRDRRGRPLVISPAGYMYQRDAERDAPATLGVIPIAPAGAPKDRGAAEALPLSAWIGISGAAASTGVGQFGSLGLSLLAGLANIRLGYWWEPGDAAAGRALRIDNVQARLADELVGRFPGIEGRRWNLTDGGHFEDSGAYELVRRRAAFIIVSDNGADPDYGFADLVTLTRRIKIDFDAELRFLNEAELDRLLGTRTRLRQSFGSLQALGIGKDEEPRIGPYAALGRIRYAGAPPAGVPARGETTFLLIKPRVCGAEAIDLVAYAKANPPFPQQSTLDQFFDEAQWESYFSLGRVIGAHLFADPAAVGEHAAWCPATMRPLPQRTGRPPRV